MMKSYIRIERSHSFDEKIEFEGVSRSGFQIGGYHSNTHFVCNGSEPGCCLELFLHSDGEFPTDKEEEMIQLHICDFKQIERWVKFWGEVLRQKGVIIDEEN